MTRLRNRFVAGILPLRCLGLLTPPEAVAADHHTQEMPAL